MMSRAADYALSVRPFWQAKFVLLRCEIGHLITALITQTSACSLLLLLLLYSAVKFTSKLFGRALSKRIKATVLYATETGKSEQYAKQLCELLGHAFNAQVSFT